ncbi:MAG: ComEC/Rec2 family competence protein, partial [Pseudomonadota bacterium]
TVSSTLAGDAPENPSLEMHWTPIDPKSADGSVIPMWSGADELVDTDGQTADRLTDGIEFRLPPTTVWKKWLLRGGLAGESLRDAAAVALAREAERGAALLWAPVFFGVGSILYFALPREPLTGAFAAAALLLWIATRSLRSAPKLLTLTRCLALVALGAAMAQLHTLRIATPTVERPVSAKLIGTVIRAEHRANGSVRYTMRLNSASRDAVMPKVLAGHIGIRSGKPLIVRATARKHDDPARIGERVSGTVRIAPPSGPIYPGSYDFAFNSWFAGIGASGFFLGSPTRLAADPNESLGVVQSTRRIIGRVRESVALILRENLPGQNGGLAAALIVGDRSGIDEDTQTALRQSGLAHILAISGLHMALVAASVMIAVRGLLACFPAIALHHPTRKWAAATALGASSVYLLLSGGSVSAQRAYVMIAVMLLAILLDRRAVTMRNVAIAAMIILLIAPHAILSPGFQMSFAAVAALVATYEGVNQRARSRQKEYRAGRLAAVGRFLRRDIGGLALTSLVAGVATAFFAAYHFHNVAAWGLVANLLAMPFVTFGVMPMAVVSMIAMPFGLELAPLTAMGWMMERVVAIASWVSDLSGPNKTGFIPVAALLFGTLGLLVLTLSRTNLRWCAIPFLVLPVVLLSTREMPDLLILENGRQIGLLDERGKLHLLRPGADKFSTQVWRKAFESGAIDDVTVGKNRKRGAKGPAFTCDEFGCSTATTTGLRIAVLESTARIQEDCALADILIIPFAVPRPCGALPDTQRPLVLDRQQLQTRGGAALYGTGGPVLASYKKGIALDRTETTPQQRLNHLRIRRARGPNPRPWTAHLYPAQELPVSAK